jgi:arylsulfatase A-like enzyme
MTTTSSTGLAALLVLVFVSTAEAVEKPNIVYIMADELGYYELSHMGHPHIRTPHIDRMAREGVRFTQALAGSSLCAPTRCCLMTGKHSGHTSVRSNGGGTPLRAGEETVASVLKKVGYATAGFGKWGCGGRGSTGVPEKHGFDRFVGYYDQVHAHSYYPKYIVDNSKELVLAGNRGGGSGKTYSHYVIVDEAMKFIRANKDRPFFCYMPVTPPHGMFNLPDSDPAWQLYKDRPWSEDARRYAAMVTMLDRQVGDVLKLLEELGLDGKTIVFFCGDNGGNDYFKSNERPRGFHAPNVDPRSGVEFRGHKGNLYEGGLRIPMIARWPGHIAPGRTSDFLWYFPDVLPTFAELAGVAAPADIDGISIVPELIGEKSAGRAQKEHEFLYWELGAQIAVRHRNWKLVRSGGGRRSRGIPTWELYDLSQDISEKNDVAAKNPKLLAKLKAFAKKSHTEVSAGVFHDRDIHERDRQAKWGDTRRTTSRARGKVERLPKKGLIPNAGWKVLRVSSEAKSGSRLAIHAIDGNPRTHWHTRFSDGLAKHPHELVIDLGATHRIAGFVLLARQDSGWNGAIGKCELFVSDSPTEFGEPVKKAKLEKTRKAQRVTCDPVRGRYVRLRILDELSGGAWASLAELGLLKG